MQEALTNALKHAEQPASVEVRLAFDDPDVSVRITDDGGVTVAVPASASGNGTVNGGADGNGRGGAIGRRPRAGRHGGARHRVRGHALGGPAAHAEAGRSQPRCATARRPSPA